VPAAYESEVILCLQAPGEALQVEAISALKDIGTAKCVAPLRDAQAHLDMSVKKDKARIDMITRAITAIQTRIAACSSSKPVGKK